MPRDLVWEIGLPLAGAMLLLVAVVVILFVRSRGLGSAKPEAAAATGAPPAPQHWLWAAVCMTTVFLTANHLLVRGAAVGVWDAEGQFFPYFVLVADHVRAGHLLTWDPFTHGGLPLLGDPQVGAFSPVMLAFGLLFGGSAAGFLAYWLFMWWLGGAAMLLLARHLGAPAWGACLVAIGFLFCGVYTGNAEHTPWIAAYSFLPLVVWRLDAALLSGRWLPAVQAGALWGLSGMAGYPGVVVITGWFCALWALGRWVSASRARPTGSMHNAPTPGSQLSGPSARHALGSIVVLALVGLIVLAPTYVSFFHEGAGTQPRVGALDRARALSNQLDPAAVATAASPYGATLKVQHPALWPSSDVSMVNIYMGVLVPGLAVLALVAGWRERWRWWLAGLAALCLGTAMGESLPLRGWLYDAIPPMRYFRHSAIFRLPFVFATCTMALYATRDFARAGLWRRRPIPVVALATAILATLAFAPLLGSAWEREVPRGVTLLARVHFVVAWGTMVMLAGLCWAGPRTLSARRMVVLAIGLAAADAVLTSTLSIPTVLRMGEAREHWQALAAGHVSSLDLLANGLHREITACPELPLEQRCRQNGQMITKIPVFNAYSSERNPRHLAMVGNEEMRRAATGGTRTWFAVTAPLVAPDDATFTALLDRAEALGIPPIVVHEPAAVLGRSAGAPPGTTAGIADLPAATPVESEVRVYTPVHLTLDVAVPTAGWLMVTDRWARGWRATVDGVPQPLYVANFIFRAVQVPGGSSRVSFTYHPLAVPWLVALSWGTLTLVLLGSTRTVARHARMTRPSSGEGGV
jgi:hypothetical protein